jgi:hypothetical protein
MKFAETDRGLKRGTTQTPHGELDVLGVSLRINGKVRHHAASTMPGSPTGALHLHAALLNWIVATCEQDEREGRA